MTGNSRKDSLSAGPALRSGGAGIAAGSARFSQKELRELSFEISARWFFRAPSPRLTLSVVHPWRVHAYWYVTPAMMNEALSATKAPQVLAIRFFDLTPGQTSRSAEETRFDIEVDGLDNNWYVDLWQPGRRYIAELGLRGADNAFHRFVRSNEIQVPRAEPSPALAFDLARYQGAKPISGAGGVSGSAFSVSGLTGLLPPFSSFPNRQTDAVDQKVGEPAFPSAPLVRVRNWDGAPTIDDGATTAAEPSGTGKDFPTVSIETDNSDASGMAGSDSPIDYAAVPELPEIDPETVSDSSLVFASGAPPRALAPEQSGTGTEQRAASDEKPQTTSSLLPGDSTVQTSSQVDVDALEAFRRGTEGQTPAASTTTPDNDRAATRDRSAGNPDEPDPATAEARWSADRHLPGGPAPKPVIPLEQAIAETYFSVTSDDKSLDLSVQLELSGVADAGQVLTVFGEPVEVDEQGCFSFRIRLNKGPHLAALIRAHRRVIPEPH